jgi:CheY-like chemotaxis protein
VVDKFLLGRRVLVVEDETLVLMMIEAMLADLGCESITTAGTVDKALALIDAQIFDVAMLDMNLKGNAGHSVAQALVACGVPFLYATGNNGHEMRDGYLNRPVLKKPFKEEEMGETLRRLLSDREISFMDRAAD